MTQNIFDYIALVDDNSATNFYHKVIIKNAKICRDILIFENAESALAHLRDSSSVIPSIIFLDINMPKITGWDFLDRFAEIPLEKRPPIVMMTSSISDEVEKKANEHPLVYKLICKSISLEQLKSIRKDLLE